MLYIGLNRETHEKIFLSKTIRPRAMIFGKSVTLWIMPLGPKSGPTPGVTYFKLAYIGKTLKNLLV